jgi:hypothetical protein
MASVFYCFVKTKNEQFSMDDFGEKKPFSIYLGRKCGKAVGRTLFPDDSRFSWAKA